MKAGIVRALLITPVILAVSVATGATSTVAAQSRWLCDGTQLAHPNECTIQAKSLETIVFADEAPGIELTVDCLADVITAEGAVGPTVQGEITRFSIVGPCKASPDGISLSDAAVKNGCVALEALSFVGLPWETIATLVKAEGLPYVRLSPGGAGQPGFTVSCTMDILGIPMRVRDTCKSTAGHEVLAQLYNVSPTEQEFPRADLQLFPNGDLVNGQQEFLTCSLGGPQTGDMAGELSLAATLHGKPATLEVSGKYSPHNSRKQT